MVIISPGQYYPSPDFDFPPGSSIAPLIVEARCIDYIQLNIDKIIILKESSLCLPNHNKVNLQSTFSHSLLLDPVNHNLYSGNFVVLLPIR